MKNKIILITGANSGIGKATLYGLAKKEAHIVMLCRNKEKSEKVRKEVIAKTGNKNIDLQVIDLSDLNSVRKTAEKINQNYKQIDVLINNAGASFIKRELSADGYEKTFAINHLGHFLLTNLLLDKLKKAESARIINVSSIAHIKGYINFDDLNAEKNYKGMPAYRRAKLANILFTNELAGKLKNTEITVNSLHPGIIRTNFTQNAGFLINTIAKLVAPFLTSPAKGAETSIYLASSDKVSGITGKYFVNCKIKDTNEEAKNEEIAKRLWKISEKMTGLNNNHF